MKVSRILCLLGIHNWIKNKRLCGWRGIKRDNIFNKVIWNGKACILCSRCNKHLCDYLIKNHK